MGDDYPRCFSARENNHWPSCDHVKTRRTRSDLLVFQVKISLKFCLFAECLQTELIAIQGSTLYFIFQYEKKENKHSHYNNKLWCINVIKLEVCFLHVCVCCHNALKCYVFKRNYLFMAHKAMRPLSHFLCSIVLVKC